MCNEPRPVGSFAFLRGPAEPVDSYARRHMATLYTMRILVTGASGFVGSNIARALCADGHDVFATGTRGEQKVPPSATLFPSIAAIDWNKIGTLDALVHEAATTDTSVHDRRPILWGNVASCRATLHQSS